MQVITSEKIPIKLWLDDIEEGALSQARNLANLPFAFRHVAIMPDSHQGYGMPIGGVLATKEVVIPNAVGVDIGCGMCAVRTSLTRIDTDTIKQILGRVRASVPVGFKHLPRPVNKRLMPAGFELAEMPVVQAQYDRARHQLGTLGGGNHFIEIQCGSDSHIWIMIHSGSRNLGKQVADHYNRLAVNLNAQWHAPVPRQHQLAYLPIEHAMGAQYLREMAYCVAFAQANRDAIMGCCMAAFGDTCDFDPPINIAHNYAAFERHFDEPVVVHRKGATRAGRGQVGIIPGSQGSTSYIVMGTGNPESFESCAHGAGRRMGRKQAQRQLDLKAEQQRLEAQGVVHAVRGRRDLDEAPGAYKDIDRVMRDQHDLVEVVTELTPLGVIKG